MKIVVVGLGYVGLSTAVTLAQCYDVVGLDIMQDKIDKLNNDEVPFKDDLIEEYLQTKQINLKLEINDGKKYDGAKFVIIALPTDYDNAIGEFDTKTVEQETEKIYKSNPEAIIVIRSTLPIGFAARIRKKYEGIKLIVTPEFLREGSALYDSLHPSRIVVGTDLENGTMIEMADSYLHMIKNCIFKDDVQTLVVDYTEAEAVKLFSNSYLALRVAFFNELDTFAETMQLDSRRIIEGVCMDTRIGSFYNNPSFGYGGYCLTKDTKELLHCYGSLPQTVISATVAANEQRAFFITQKVLERLRKCSTKKAEPTVGIYTLSAKSGINNSRQAAIYNVIKFLVREKLKLIIYEPHNYFGANIPGTETVNNLEEFKSMADIIIANRYDKCLDDVRYKVYTRDVFGRD